LDGEVEEGKGRGIITKISILDVSAGFAFGSDDVMTLFGEVLDEHFLGMISLKVLSMEIYRGGGRNTVAKVMTNVAAAEQFWIS